MIDSINSDLLLVAIATLIIAAYIFAILRFRAEKAKSLKRLEEDIAEAARQMKLEHNAIAEFTAKANKHHKNPIGKIYGDGRYQFREVIKPVHGGLAGVRVRMRKAIEREWRGRDGLVTEIQNTNWHEIAYYNKVKGWVYHQSKSSKI